MRRAGPRIETSDARQILVIFNIWDDPEREPRIIGPLQWRTLDNRGVSTNLGIECALFGHWRIFLARSSDRLAASSSLELVRFLAKHFMNRALDIHKSVACPITRVSEIDIE